MLKKMVNLGPARKYAFDFYFMPFPFHHATSEFKEKMSSATKIRLMVFDMVPSLCHLLSNEPNQLLLKLPLLSQPLPLLEYISGAGYFLYKVCFRFMLVIRWMLRPDKGTWLVRISQGLGPISLPFQCSLIYKNSHQKLTVAHV